MPQNPSPRDPARATMSPVDSASSDILSPASTTSSSSISNTTLIENYLCNVTRDIVAATNARNWDPTTYPWNHIAQDEFIAGATYASLPVEIGFQQFLQGFKNVYDEKGPDYHILVQDVSANVPDKTGKATVLLTMENVNFSPGVLRYSVGKLEFVGRGSGFWQCIRYSSYPIGGESIPV